MSLDFKRKEEKEIEINNLAKKALSNMNKPEVINNEMIETLFNYCISISAPEKEEQIMHMITMFNDGRGGAKSVKPGNITFDIKNMIAVITSGTLTITGTPSNVFLILLAAINVYISLINALTIKLSETDAVVIYAMWMRKDTNNVCGYENLLDTCNGILEKYGLNKITENELKRSIKNLEDTKCIKKSIRHMDSFLLQEKLKVSYR